MIISRTPFRISFFGGGTDYPTWYHQHGGAVLAVTIDKYCYLTCRYLPPFFEHNIRVVYSRIENCHNLDEIEHPSAREVLRYLDIQNNVEIHHDGDLPARSGMGSSSSFTVGLLHALHALKGEMAGRRELAETGIHIEQNILKETVGSQDQILAAYGGFNHIVFRENGDFLVHPVVMSPQRLEDLESHIMLLYTGIKRTASNIAQSYVPNLDDKRRQLRIMQQMVNEALSILGSDRDITEFGALLHEAWQVKRSLGSRISNPEIDQLYESVMKAGASGGKITGAGGGGFLLLVAPPDRHEAIRQACPHLIHVPIRFETQGSQIIFYERDMDYSAIAAQRREQPTANFREADDLMKALGN